MRVLISGYSGLVGTELSKQLRELGHEPVALVRRTATRDNEVSWNPGVEELDDKLMESIDAVVNLGGATTGRIPWTKKYMQTIISSRLDSTKAHDTIDPLTIASGELVNNGVRRVGSAFTNEDVVVIHRRVK